MCEGYAWDCEILLELLATSGLITLILHSAAFRIFQMGKHSHRTIRLLLLFSLVLITLLTISR